MRDATGLWVLACVVLSGCGGNSPRVGGAGGTSPAAPAGMQAPPAGASGAGTGSGGVAGGAAGTAAGSGAMSGGTSGAGGTGQVLDAWPATGTSCGDLGKECSQGCGTGTSCLAGTDICVPPSNSVLCTPGTCPDRAPYCVARLCMTEQQATCVCAADGGKAHVDVCTQSPAAARGPADACLGEAAICASAPNKCCAGLFCLRLPNVLAQCWQPCPKTTTCTTGCCAMASGSEVCAPASACM